MASSAPKPTIQSWQQHWQGRKTWAQEQGISYSDYQSVVKYDYNRMTNPQGFGAPMSDTEAFDAMMSLKSGKDPFSAPDTTAPTILSNPMKAIHDNVQNIFTGLFHAPDAIWQDVNSLVHGHPGKIANLIPGYTDITSLFSGQGRQYLLENPISDLLDLGGIGKIGDLAETGLRQAGYAAAADTLKAIPDHPMSMAVKALTNQLVSHLSVADKIQRGFIDTAEHFGQTAGQKQWILRPSRTLKKMVQATPWPDYHVQLQAKFGQAPKGTSVLTRTNELAKSMTQQERDEIASVISYNDYRGQVMTPRDFIKNPDIPKVQRVAMKAMTQALSSLQLAKELDDATLKPVYNPETNDIGYVPDKRDANGNWSNSSSWDKYIAALDKLGTAQQSAATSLVEHTQSIYQSMQTLKNGPTDLPQALNWDQPTLPVALNRVGDFLTINKDRYFNSIPDAYKRSVPKSLYTSGEGGVRLRIEPLDSPMFAMDGIEPGHTRLFRAERDPVAAGATPASNPEASLNWYPDYQSAQADLATKYGGKVYYTDVPDEVLSKSFVPRDAGNKPFYTFKGKIRYSNTTVGVTKSGWDASMSAIHGDLAELSRRVNSINESANTKSLQTIITKLRRDVRRSNMPESDIRTWIMDQSANIIHESNNLKKEYANEKQLVERQASTKRSYDASKRQLQYKWNRYTQGRFEALVKRKMQQNIREHFDSHFVSGELHEVRGVEITPEMIDKAFEDIGNGNYFSQEVKSLIPAGTWVDIQKSAYLFIDELKAQGYDPIYTTAIDPESIGSIESGAVRTDTSRYARLASEHETAGVLTSHIYNAWVAIPKEASDIYYKQAVRTLIDDFFARRTISFNDMVTMSKSFYLKRGKGDIETNDLERATAFKQALGYTEWDPQNMLGFEKRTKTLGPPGKDTLYIKQADLDLIQKSYHEMDKTMNKAFSAAMNGYRLGVLYASPRYAAHIALGGAMMTALRMDHPLVDSVRYLRDAHHMASDPTSFPLYMSKGVAEQDVRGNLVSDPFGVHNHFVGRKIGDLAIQESMLTKGLSKVEAGLGIYKRALEHISDTQRALSFLAAKSRATAADLTPDIVAEAKLWHMKPEEVIGAKAANKALADMDVVSPFERAILMRYAMPFWGWTRHILRYVTTFPRDYPLRAGIINALSEQAIGSSSDLPNYLDRLLFLGAPNQQGNVTVLDWRQWNPFRDVANYMTWGGVVASLNPVISAALNSAFGVDPATGGPNLYPELTYDSFYGSTSSPAGENYFTSLLQQFSPQISTLTQVMSKTSVLRSEAYNDPSKLPYLIGDSIGIPWIPYTINTKQEQIKTSNDQYSVASKAVQKALTANDPSALNGYEGLLPYSGYEVNKGYLQELIAAANKENAAAGTTIPALDLFAQPYADTYSPEYLLAGPTSLPNRQDQEPGGLKQ